MNRVTLISPSQRTLYGHMTCRVRPCSGSPDVLPASSKLMLPRCSTPATTLNRSSFSLSSRPIFFMATHILLKSPGSSSRGSFRAPAFRCLTGNETRDGQVSESFSLVVPDELVSASLCDPTVVLSSPPALKTQTHTRPKEPLRASQSDHNRPNNRLRPRWRNSTNSTASSAAAFNLLLFGFSHQGNNGSQAAAPWTNVLVGIFSIFGFWVQTQTSELHGRTSVFSLPHCDLSRGRCLFICVCTESEFLFRRFLKLPVSMYINGTNWKKQ